ncbi:hypothetical protein PHLGIDRAFT_119048 [Phlebiopsis gigantea 11061_1 CR5-6]|uniref:Uncharacterized protein n=1 Tax=Phlebiopsis gigantea (strain 11061_1 CR5-6) TaxID=745531 RepID=A0A0C3S9N6_PHLG1|nr:hypothetical protein PHLGIDRAFT_119048 [Phlebiopsis gigantea 11061_1 CR5-6]
MFRLPTHLEELIPPPNRQVAQTNPWRGSLVLSSRSPTARGQPELRCTAAETGGDNQVEFWPASFVVEVMGHRPLLAQLTEWLKSNKPPMCMFMPDRLADQAAHRANQAAFESLATALGQSQTVAVLPWNTPGPLSAGAGIIIFPTGSSRNLLVGALFPDTTFPEFIGSPSLIPRSIPYSPTSGHDPFDPAPPNIAASQRQASGSQSRFLS